MSLYRLCSCFIGLGCLYQVFYRLATAGFKTSLNKGLYFKKEGFTVLGYGGYFGIF